MVSRLDDAGPSVQTILVRRVMKSKGVCEESNYASTLLGSNDAMGQCVHFGHDRQFRIFTRCFNHPPTTMKSFTLSLLLVLVFVLPSAAQEMSDADSAAATPPDPAVPQGENHAVPDGWLFRLDRPSPDTRLVTADEEVGHINIHFVNMTPGWHITTGPAAILYHPALTATGDFRAEVEIHLFEPGERNEAFGIFIGGSALDADEQSYLYFLIRKTGEFLVKRRDGASTSTVKDWTSHPAIVPFTDETEGTATNVLAVESGPEQLRFFVNDAEVAAVPRGELPVDGLVGMRVNHALNLHVSDLSVEPLD